MAKTKSIGFRELYSRYPFKKNPDDYIPGVTTCIPNPYVKAEDCTDTEYSVDFKTYVKIIDTFLGFLFQYLLEGGRYKMPGRIGDLIMYKYKRSVKKYIRWDFFKTEGVWVNEKLIPTNRYSPTIKWKRGKHMNALTAMEVNWWNWYPSRKAALKMKDWLVEDPSRIYKLQTYSRR